MILKAIPGKQNQGLYKYNGSKKDSYVVRRECAGKPTLNRRLVSDNLSDARKEANELIREWLGLKPKTQTKELIEELWPKWIETKSERAKNTLESIKYSWARLQPFWGAMLPNEITPITWEKYVSNIRMANPDTKLFNDRKWFRSFILWLHENGLINNCPRLRNPDPSKSDAGRYVSKEEFTRLLTESNPELQLQLLMAYTMGMRISEIMCLTWGKDKQNTSYVDLEKKIIHLHKKDTKIRRSRTFGISDKVYPELVLRRKASTSEFVWPSLSDTDKPMTRQGHKKAWELARKRAGVQCRLHDLRHSFLTNAFKAGEGKIDSMLICEYAGLSIEVAQSTYLHFSYEDTRAVAGLVDV